MFGNLLSSFRSLVGSGVKTVSGLLGQSKQSQVASLQNALQTDLGPGFDPRSGIQRQTPLPNISLITGNVGAADPRGNITEVTPGGRAIPFSSPGRPQSQFTRQRVRQAIPTRTFSSAEIQDLIDRFSQPGAGQSRQNDVQRIITEETSRRRPGIPTPGRGGRSRSARPELANQTITENGFQTVFDEQGNPVSITPLSGGSGTGGFTFATPNQPRQGEFGGGIPSFTGSLSAAGGLGPQSLSTDEDLDSQGPVSAEDIRSLVQQAATPFPISPIRDTLTPALNAAATAPRVEAPTITNEVAADSIAQGIQATPLSRQTIASELERITQEAMRIKGVLDSGAIEEPIVDTEAQLEWLQQGDDPFGRAQAIDNYTRQETALIQIQQQIGEVFNGIDAVTQAYEAVYDDIRENPNLPKGLAQRRLEHLYSKEKATLDSLTTQLQRLQMMKDDQNQMVNRAFNIFESAEQRARQARQDAMQIMNFYVNSGAIAAFSDREIDEFGLAIGIDPKGLRRVRDVKQQEQTKRNLEIRNQGDDLVVFDKGTRKVVSRIKGAPSGTGDTPEIMGPLSPLDLQRTLELFPWLNLRSGMTQTDVDAQFEKQTNEARNAAIDDILGGVTDLELLVDSYPELDSVELQTMVARQLQNNPNLTTNNTEGTFFQRVFGGQPPVTATREGVGLIGSLFR